MNKEVPEFPEPVEPMTESQPEEGDLEQVIQWITDYSQDVKLFLEENLEQIYDAEDPEALDLCSAILAEFRHKMEEVHFDLCEKYGIPIEPEIDCEPDVPLPSPEIPRGRYGRACDICNMSIEDRPPNHTLCGRCYRR